MRTANYHEKPSKGTDAAISDHPVQKRTGISYSTLNSLFQTPICELWGTGREHMDTQHNTRAYFVQHHRTAAALHTLLCSYRRHIQHLPSQTTAALSQHFCWVVFKLSRLSGYLAQWQNLIGRGPKFYIGDFISVNQTSDNKGAICCCLWNWVTSVGGQGGWREYGKIFSNIKSSNTSSPNLYECQPLFLAD